VVSKKPRSFTIDEDIAEELSKREDINASAVVNNYLREFLDATDATEDEVIVREIDRQIDDIDEEIQDKESKRGRLERRKERILERDDEDYGEEEQQLLEKLRQVPRDPEHPLVQEVAEKLDMDPSDAIQEAYDR